MEKIKQRVKEYLIANNLWFEPINKKDDCIIRVKEIGEYYYVECRSNRFQKEIKPGEKGYHPQAEGIPCDIYDNNPSYRLVFAKNGEELGDVVIGAAEINDHDISLISAISPDSENIFVQIKEDYDNNRFQHYKKENDKFVLKGSFLGRPNVSEELLSKKLIFCGGKLYNFEKEECHPNTFDMVLAGDELYQAETMEDFAMSWGIPYEQRDEFVKFIVQKMQTSNLVSGHRKVKVKKEGVWLEYNTLIFIDENGNFVGNLYYIDENYKVVSIENVTPQNYETVLTFLKDRLTAKVEEMILQRDRKNNILSRIRQKMAFVGNDKISINVD